MSIVVILRDNFALWGRGSGDLLVEARDAAKHSTMYRIGPHNKELSSPKYQQNYLM